MTTTQTQLFAPPTRSNAVDAKGFLAIPFRQWLFTLQNLLPLVEVDTLGGDEVLQLPPAGLNENTGQSNQNQEIVYVKTSSDGNTASITGAETGAIILRKQWDSARFKSDGTNWINSGVGSSSGPGAASFALLTSGENNDAAMVVGHGASLSRDGDGLIDASEIGGIKIPAGTAASTVGKVPISQGDGTAAWADPLVQGILPPGTNADTGNGGTPINPVLGGARRTTDAELQDLSCDADNNLNVNVQASALSTGASTSANQTNGSQKSQSVDGAGNVQPAGDTPARSIQVEQTDGTNVIGTLAHPTRVDPTGTTTQPISGTVTANAGTNMSTASLALETGGNLATLAGIVTSSRAAVKLYIGSQIVVGAVPSAGAEIATVVPSGTYKLKSVRFVLAASSATANRLPLFYVTDGSGNVFVEVAAMTAIPASQLGLYTAAPGIALSSVIFPGTPNNDYINAIPIPEIIVLGGYKLNTATAGLQSGDQYNGIFYQLEQIA